MTFTRQGKKSRIAMVGIALILLVALLFTLACTSPAPAPSSPSSPSSPGSPTSGQPLSAPQYHWRFQSPYAEADLEYQITTKGVASLIEKASGGQVKVDTYPAGALVSESEMLSAVIDGTIEVAINMNGAQGELIPTDYCTALIGSADTLGEYYDLSYRTGIFDIVQQDFEDHGLHLVAVTLPGPACLYASFRFDSWDALKGKKGWAAPPEINVLSELGGVCVDVPGYDMYSAMRLGTIEWFEWSVAELETLSLKEVTKSFVAEPILKPAANDIFINLDAWEALSPELQQRIGDAVKYGLADLGLEYRYVNAQALVAAEDYGVEIIRMSDADRAKFKELSYKDWETVAKIDPRCAQCIDLAKQWVVKIAPIRPI